MLRSVGGLAIFVGASAHRQFIGQIPNGDAFGAVWPAVGHVAPEPSQLPSGKEGFLRNPFGLDFAKHGFRWTPELCERDSDGDGLTNGQELGDPHCTWHAGMPAPQATQLSHPGLPHVALGELKSYWAGAKQRVANQTSSIAMNHGSMAPAIFYAHYINTPFWTLFCIGYRFFRKPGSHYPSFLWVCVLTYLIGHVGVFCGNHRCYSHSACKPTRAGHWVLGFLSMLAMQGPCTHWALYHRTHHRFCEQTPYDVHSPHIGGGEHGGFMWAQGTFFFFISDHVGYDGNKMSIIADLEMDPDIPAINKSASAHILAYFSTLALVAVAGTVYAAWTRRDRVRDLVHGGAVSAGCGKTKGMSCLAWECAAFALTGLTYYLLLPGCLSMQITSFVNSAVHMWGDMPYEDAMSAPCTTYNNAFLFWPMLGENWHNNHHGNPLSHSTWVEWYQVDFQGMSIRVLELLGLATDVQTVLPTKLRDGYTPLPFWSVCLSWAQMGVVMLMLTLTSRWLLCDEPFPWSTTKVSTDSTEPTKSLRCAPSEELRFAPSEEVLPLTDENDENRDEHSRAWTCVVLVAVTLIAVTIVAVIFVAIVLVAAVFLNLAEAFGLVKER
jgi:fatty-acid desaturase